MLYQRAIAEQTLTEYILPLPTLPSSSSSRGVEIDEVAWTDRLLLTMRYLDEVSINTLFNFANLKGRSVCILLRQGHPRLTMP